MVGKKTQNEQENEILKAAFKDNESLLKLMRAVFFGFDLSDKEKNEIKSAFASKELRDAVRKKTYPIISQDVPIGHEADFWSGMESQIIGHPQDSIYQVVQAKKEVLKLFTQSFGLLENPFGTPIDFSYNPDNALDPMQIKLLARNLYFKTITVALATIKIIAEQKGDETPQEVAKRLNADSNK